ncbi:calcium-activated potassium channel subunit [Branchiostoma belcheri]|nr:calcium-activated potassium channel subunit [Branchiostoma belcheri]
MDKQQSALGQYNMYKMWLIVAVSVTAGCVAAIVVCGIVIVKPIVETNSLEFKETTCTTTRSYFTGRDIACDCGKNCKSTFPCLHVTVSYTDEHRATHSGVLFDTEQRLNQDGHSDEEVQCATAPCDRNKEETRKEVENFQDTHAAGQSYKCLYNPDNTEQVLLKRLFTWDDMFHSMLWSSIGFVICAGVTVYIYLRCKKAERTLDGAPVFEENHTSRT